MAEENKGLSMNEDDIKVELIEWPTDDDWKAVKARALVTVGKTPVNPPDEAWKHAILEARHSPIRRLNYAFRIECPSYVSVHLVRHIHAQPYVKSQRNDRQKDYDRKKAPQDAPVTMIWDVNAEELQVVANKRLCTKADPVTRRVVQMCCNDVFVKAPEFVGLLVPWGIHCGGLCHEMDGCGKCKDVALENIFNQVIDKCYSAQED